MKINDAEIDSLARFEAKEIIHTIAAIMSSSLSYEDKACKIEDILEEINILGK